jgi:DNA-binding Lrp family transcriptional regulator
VQEGRITNIKLSQRWVCRATVPAARCALEDAGYIQAIARASTRRCWASKYRVRDGRPARPVEPDLRVREPVLGWPLVRECYMMSGETDYILRCVAPDLGAFQDFVIKELTAAPNVASVKTSLAIRRAKLDPGIPITIPRG